MIKIPLPKLTKWLIKQILFSVILSSLLGIFCLYIFFSAYKISDVVFIAFFGFLFSFSIFIFLFFRFLRPLTRVFNKVQSINKGKNFSAEEEPYLDEEPGEFYDLNKSLNQINSYLKWQKKNYFSGIF